jgi:2-C-methyl-D-erythritol 4-phosphate cytidylyltransferase/2-C-methyl-D-erythritol 2,4-cyclodiphosphate synthase
MPLSFRGQNSAYSPLHFFSSRPTRPSRISAMVINAAVIIPAAGSGSRMGLDMPKQFHDLAGLPILVRTVRAFHSVSDIETIVLPVPPDSRNRVEDMSDKFKLTPKGGKLLIVNGGSTRQDSVRAGLDALPPATEVVLVHDGARPLVSTRIIEACLREAARCGAAIAAVPVSDTLKAVNAEKRIRKTVDRQGLWQAQTPQAARVALLKEAYAAAEKTGFVGTDEASLLEQIDCPVKVVAGSQKNIKITLPEDLLIAEAILMQNGQSIITSPPDVPALRVGHGYDAHRFTGGRPLVLGGVTVPHSEGLLGHSDADVLTHAFCDAILGALGGGDIGRHFPDSDQQYKNIRSINLLEQVMALTVEQNYSLTNGDITIVAQQPKLSPFLLEMKTNLARACRVDQDRINIKATTTEKMGFIGRGEGIGAHAVVLLEKRESPLRNQASG